jgi:hypothetical protein
VQDGLRTAGFVILGVVLVQDAVGSVSLGGFPYAIAVLLAAVACFTATRYPPLACAAAGTCLLAAAAALLWLPYGHDLGVAAWTAAMGVGFLVLAAGFAVMSAMARVVGLGLIAGAKAALLVFIVATWSARHLLPSVAMLAVPIVACVLLAWGDLARQTDPQGRAVT